MFFIRCTAFCALSLSIFLAGCTGSQAPVEQPPTGVPVTVQIRRDALGSAHTLPIPPTTSVQNGAKVCIEGQISRINSEWIVLLHQDRPHWIPRDSVLLIQVHQR